MTYPGSDSPLLILVAVHQEAAPIRKLMSPAHDARLERFAAWSGHIGKRSVVLLVSGMGPQRAAEAARMAIKRFRPHGVLACGFAGSLWEEVLPGDLVIATDVIDATGLGFRSMKPAKSGGPKAANLGAFSVEVALRSLEAPIVSVQAPVASPLAKRSIAATVPRAAAVDMETAGIVFACRLEGAPCFAVRAITDGFHQALPVDFERYEDYTTGEVSPSRLALGMLMRPWLLPGLIALGARSARAAQNLATFVAAYCEQAVSAELERDTA